MSTPDLAGFAEAQDRLRTLIGIDAVFIHDGSKTWAADVQLNPRTGEPYDPFATPDTEDAERRETVRCGVFSRLLRAGKTDTVPIGRMADSDLILTFDLTDLPRVKGADRVEAQDELWELRSTEADTIGDRGIAFLEHA